MTNDANGHSNKNESRPNQFPKHLHRWIGQIQVYYPGIDCFDKVSENKTQLHVHHCVNLKGRGGRLA